MYAIAVVLGNLLDKERSEEHLQSSNERTPKQKQDKNEKKTKKKRIGRTETRVGDP